MLRLIDIEHGVFFVAREITCCDLDLIVMVRRIRVKVKAGCKRRVLIGIDQRAPLEEFHTGNTNAITGIRFDV
mgnify:CR=1 FL=1